jgi:hypothetical protein
MGEAEEWKMAGARPPAPAARVAEQSAHEPRGREKSRLFLTGVRDMSREEASRPSRQCRPVVCWSVGLFGG